MPSEIVPQEPTHLKPAETVALPAPTQDLVVLARDPQEMAQAQQGLIAWMTTKVEQEEAELAEAQANLDHAIRTKIRTEGWRTQVTRVQKRVTYYKKALAALEEGYCIVPEMPVDLIAIRTTRKKPNPKWKCGGMHMLAIPETTKSPLGEGRYVSPDVEGQTKEVPVTRTRHDGTKYQSEQTYAQAIDFLEVDFPFKTVKPQIMAGLSRAMQQKIFDEIGVLPARRRGGDPLIVGNIVRKDGYSEHRMSFLIAWWIDTRDL